jgi:hypothetical protein
MEFWHQAIAAMGITAAKLTVMAARQAREDVIEIGPHQSEARTSTALR